MSAMLLITSLQNRTRFWQVYNSAESVYRDAGWSCESQVLIKWIETTSTNSNAVYSHDLKLLGKHLSSFEHSEDQTTHINILGNKHTCMPRDMEHAVYTRRPNGSLDRPIVYLNNHKNEVLRTPNQRQVFLPLSRTSILQLDSILSVSTCLPCCLKTKHHNTDLPYSTRTVRIWTKHTCCVPSTKWNIHEAKKRAWIQ